MTDTKVEPSVFTRDFNAPMQLVYEAWTEPDHLCKWQVPNAEIIFEFKSVDIRAGGSALHKMVMPNGHEMWLLTRYEELSPYHRIVFRQYESNSDGEIMPPSMPNWPREIEAAINLSENNGVTHMEFQWRPINPTPDEVEAWEASRPQHGKGWGGSFELLAGYLSQTS